jgi:hypothetical protein
MLLLELDDHVPVLALDLTYPLVVPAVQAVDLGLVGGAEVIPPGTPSGPSTSEDMKRSKRQ